MKAALVYTSTTPELTELVEKEVRKHIGNQAELISYQNPDVLALTRDAGHVTKEAAALLVHLFMQAIIEGADAILNICSSVGETADAVQELAQYTGIPIVRIDEEMCRDAVREGKRIGVMATLPTTLTPTKNTLLKAAAEQGAEPELIDCLVDGAFGLNQDEFKKLMLQHAETIRDQVDIIVLCQGSMAYCEELIAQQCGKPVFSSPRYGAEALRKALVSKGFSEELEGEPC